MQGIPEKFKDKPRRHVWKYRSNQGETLGYVARFDDGKKKEIVPYFKRGNDHGWQHGSATEPRPLFGLDVLNQADLKRGVFIVEGEKAAAALQSLGLIAITSQGGSNAAHKTDWNLLSERERVYLLPDNDEAGESYIKAVAVILMNLEKPPAITIVRLPNLPPAGDVVDWIASQINDWDGYVPIPKNIIDKGTLLDEFKAIVKQHCEPIPNEWIAKPAEENAGNWQAPISLESAQLPPWPDEVFPGSIRDFVSALSKSTETPPNLS